MSAVTAAAASSVHPFHRRQLPATPLQTGQQLPVPNPTWSPLSSGLPSPNFPSPMALPVQMPNVPLPPRGRSPAPSAASSRHPSRQQSVRRLSSISVIAPARQPQHFDFSTIQEDVLTEGDVIGAGDELHGEFIESVYIPTSAPRPEQPPPADHFQVVRKLGTGSYAVVYLVREILSTIRIEQPPRTGEPEDFLDSSSSSRSLYRHQFGREFAVKCLSKASLSPEELEIQMFEAKLHQSLPTHPNIVTLHRTFQTPAHLLLVLDYVPGEDLFYFLEQSRDHQWQDADSISRPGARPLPPVPGSQPTNNLGLTMTPSNPATNALMISHTPPTPSLLSTLHPQHLLSYQRLRLITSMFSQMCDAVDACHKQGVSHRDIKPENFIVTEGLGLAGEPRVVVKLSDFGLATLQQESSDVDVGSAPYMSYECRNNVAPTYATQPADVWSLGIVLINMLYHHNPWSDTATLATRLGQHNHPNHELTKQFSCSSFAAYVASPVQFFMQRFPGMTFPVANFLSSRVFCMGDVSRRLSARGLGDWVRDQLPRLMSQNTPQVSLSGSIRIGPSRLVSGWTEDDEEMSIERGPTPNLMSLMDKQGPSISTATLVAAGKDENVPPPLTIETGDGDMEMEEPGSARSPSAKRRGKRGARRKDKSQPPSLNPSHTSLQEDARLRDAAETVEQLAFEISRSTAPPTLRSSASRSTMSSRASSKKEAAINRLPPMPSVAPPVPPLPVPTYKDIGRRPALPPQTSRETLAIQHPGAAAILQSTPVTGRKSWIGRLGFGSSTPHAAPAAHDAPASLNPPTMARGSPLRNDLSQDDAPRLPSGMLYSVPKLASHPGAQWVSAEEEDHLVVNDLNVGAPPSRDDAASVSSRGRAVRPMTAVQPVKPLRTMKNNWRMSTATQSSVATQSSASSFSTRFDNASVRSVSTMATTVSGQSVATGVDGPWRKAHSDSGSIVNGGEAPPRPRKQNAVRTNVKRLDGIPPELSGLPSYMQPPPRVKGVLVTSQPRTR